MTPADSLAHRHNLNVMGGGDTTLLLVHGWGCNQAMWRSVAPVLADGFRVVLLDLAGFGLSDHGAYDPARHAGLDGHAADLLEVAALFRDQPIVLVGHSVGATIGVLADALAPGVFAAHAMVAPSPCFLDDGAYRGGFSRAQLEALLEGRAADLPAWSRALAELVGGDGSWGPVTSELVASFCRAHDRAASQLARATFLGDHRAAFARVRRPALVLQGLHDPIAPVAVGEFLRDRMASSVLRLVDTRGHAPHLTRPADCVAAIRDFLAGLVAGGLLPATSAA